MLKNVRPKTARLDRGPGLAQGCVVDNSASVQCPFCGQHFDLVIDTSVASQQFTTDCEICCRPFEVLAECAPGEILSVETQAG